MFTSNNLLFDSPVAIYSSLVMNNVIIKIVMWFFVVCVRIWRYSGCCETTVLDWYTQLLWVILLWNLKSRQHRLRKCYRNIMVMNVCPIPQNQVGRTSQRHYWYWLLTGRTWLTSNWSVFSCIPSSKAEKSSILRSKYIVV